MDTNEMNTAVDQLNLLKKDAQAFMKKGLPFILASVVIWGLILVSHILVKDQWTANLAAFVCCCLLMPLAIIFAKAVNADIFRKTKNPFKTLCLVCTFNQFLYILIAMWAFNRSPHAMLMIYAMIFGAHLLPFGWIYDSKVYTVLSIVETVGALVIGSLCGSGWIAAFILCCEIVLSVCLFRECKGLEA